MIDVAISDDKVKKNENEKLQKYKALKEELEKLSCDNWGTQSCDSQTGRVAPADSGNDIQDLCPGRTLELPLIDDPSLKDKDRLHI